MSYVTALTRWEQAAVGMSVILLAALRFLSPQLLWVSWIEVAIAVRMIVAQFATGYKATVAFWNEVIFGIILGLLAVWNTTIQPASIEHRGYPSMR